MRCETRCSPRARLSSTRAARAPRLLAPAFGATLAGACIAAGEGVGRVRRSARLERLRPPHRIRAGRNPEGCIGPGRGGPDRFRHVFGARAGSDRLGHAGDGGLHERAIGGMVQAAQAGVDDARPSAAAIERMEWPATSVFETCSRSAKLDARSDRRLTGGRLPPVAARIPRTDVWACRTSWQSGGASPFCQRSRIGPFRASVYWIRVLRFNRNAFCWIGR